MALSLSAAGAAIALAARDVEKLQAVRKEIETAGGKAAVIPTDVTREDEVARLASQVAEQFGRVQILITTTRASTSARISSISRSKSGVASWTRILPAHS